MMFQAKAANEVGVDHLLCQKEFLKVNLTIICSWIQAKILRYRQAQVNLRQNKLMQQEEHAIRQSKLKSSSVLRPSYQVTKKEVQGQGHLLLNRQAWAKMMLKWKSKAKVQVKGKQSPRTSLSTSISFRSLLRFNKSQMCPVNHAARAR